MKSQETERNEINTAYRWHTITDGCDGVAVSTVGCGPASPGSIPGHGPISTDYFCMLNRDFMLSISPKVHNCVRVPDDWMGCVCHSESK